MPMHSLVIFALVVPLCLLTACAHVAPHAEPEPEGPLRVTITNKVLHTLDARVFGQFCERAGKGEPGPEAAWDEKAGALRKDVRDALHELNVPLMRFPGGSKVEYGGPWTELIDGAFDREKPERPERCRFGFDEFMALCAELKSEPLICVRLSTSLYEWKELKLQQTVDAAAAQVAYMNAPAGGKLPPDLQRWADLRARNGHKEPYGVKLWQVGNEPIWTFARFLLEKQGMAPKDVAVNYVDFLEVHIDAMRAVDPTIKIIVEPQMEDGPTPVFVTDLILKQIGPKVDYFSHHSYYPWGIEEILREGEKVDPATFTHEQYWYAAVTVPHIDPATGTSTYAPPSMASMRASGKPLLMTEWNWNGWWRVEKELNAKMPRIRFARGVGVAGFLNAFIRNGDVIRMGTQSMMVGSRWGLSAIGVREDDPDYLIRQATGLATALYSNHHGRDVLAIQSEGGGFFEQPFKLRNIEPAPKVAYVDVTATRTGDTVYVHLINRDFRSIRPVELDFSGFAAAPKVVGLHRLTGRLHNLPADGEPTSYGEIRSMPLTLASDENGVCTLRLPPRSVSIYELKL
jgi:alpha-L-arabinofuranosidase